MHNICQLYRLGLKVGLLIIMVSISTSLSASAAITKLSGVMPSFGDVINYQVSPNGQYVVFTADKNADDVYELYSATLTEAMPTLLSGSLPADHIIAGYRISPDSMHVIYQAGLINAGTYELFSVPITGPAPGIKLNGALVAQGGVTLLGWQISPNSSRVIYIADQDTDELFELYSVPLTGPATATVKLNSPLISEGDVQSDFRISPDSSRVVYRADQEVDFQYELYSTPSDGSGPTVKINKPLVPGGYVGPFFYQVYISSDNSHVVYIAVQDTASVGELYSVPLVGPAAAGIKLSVPLSPTGDVVYAAISPNSTWVVYVADPTVDEVYEMYSAPIDQPGASIKLVGPIAWGDSPLISPDSLRVLYRASSNLYSVPVDGSATSVKLNGTLVPNGSVTRYQISLDGHQVVYRADQQTDNVYELYSVPITGPASIGVKINGQLVPGGNVDFFYQISQDSRRVVYAADQQTDNRMELYSVPLTGPASEGVKINGQLVLGGNVASFEVAPDDKQVLYRADQDTDEVFELYSTDEGQISFKTYLPYLLR